MTELLTLTNEQRRNIFNQAGFLAGLSPEVIEKDWWVTLTLKALFQSEFAEHLLFKGGTSLSKCWKLINRFSEDIDLAIDREFLGFGGELSKSQIKKLKTENSRFAINELKEAIETQLLAMGVPVGMTMLTAKPVKANSSSPDPQELLLVYPTLYDPIEYIPNNVKIEVSGRSLKEPWSVCPIQSFVGEYIPGRIFSGQPFEVPAVEPRRTFIEKIFLLHEEFLNPTGIRYERMSRHLYDLMRLMDTIHGWNAIMDTDLYETIRQHREKYYGLPGVDYNTHMVTTINFIPPATVRDFYKEDYRIMLERMIHKGGPSFEELMTALEELLERLRGPIDLKGRTLDQVIADAAQLEPPDLKQPVAIQEGATVALTITYSTDPYKPASPSNETAQFQVFFVRRNGTLIFQKIKKGVL